MRKYLPHLVVLVVLFAAGYLALAQEEQLERGPVEAQEQEEPAARGAGRAPQIEGVPGLSDTGVVVNFSRLAGKEALSPAVYRKPKVVREPGRAPRNKTVAVEAAAAQDGVTEPSAPSTGTQPLVASPAPASSFRALEDNDTAIPPDTHGAVGPNHLMVVLNTQIRIQTRAGATLSTVPTDTFWSAAPGPWASGVPNTFDPQVFYDPFSNRWMFTVVADFDAATSAILLAVSQTSDPTGNWKIYKVDVDSTNAAWADYPRMGFNKNWIVVTVNMFGISDGAFKRSSIYAFNKPTLYAFAAAAGFKVFHEACNPGASFCAFTQTPALTYNNALNTMYLVEDWDGTKQLRISSITGTPAAPAYSSSHPFTPPVADADSWEDNPATSNFAPQLGSTEKIQTNDSRIQSVVYRNGSLWAAHTIFLPNTESPTRCSVQWWQLTPAGAVQQRGRVDDPAGAKFYAFPSLAVNKNNDVLIGYTRFSSQQYPSANYAFRAGTDPVNTLRDDRVLRAGSAPYFKDFGTGRNRWGDYSSTVVDPLNDLDMWTVQEHAAPVSGGSRWGTWWGRIPSLTPAPLIQLGTVTAADGNTGDADTAIEPGESGNKLTVQLKNTGKAAATGVSAKLTTTTPGVTVTTTAPIAYPDLAASTGAGTNTTPFMFNVASTVACGRDLNFVLRVTYAGGGAATFTFTVRAARVITKSYASTAVLIPDNNAAGVNITLPVTGAVGTISDLDFKFGGTTCTTAAGATTVGLDHTWVGDLVVTLKSPQGTVVTLIDQAGGPSNDGRNFCNTTFDDESAGVSIQNVTAAGAPYQASFKPASPLSAFDGQNPNGTWTLNVSDRGPEDIGRVRRFSLVITQSCSTTASAQPLEAGGADALAAAPPAEVFVGPGAQGQSPAALLADAWAAPSGPEADALRAAFLPWRYDYLARLLSG